MRTIFKLFVLLGLALFSPCLSTLGQVSINTDNASPDPSAMLDIKSTTKGILIPRMTSIQRSGINSAASGLLVYQTDASAGFYFFNGTSWIFLGSGDGYSGNVIDIDGNVYATVKIGNQEWMAQNLKSTHYRNGETIDNITNNISWGNLITGAYCWYNNDPATYKAPYGALYNWYAVYDNRKLCPTGWHVPTDEEWTIYTTYLGGTSVAGGKMKAAILWASPNSGAININGFSALPGGDRFETGAFNYVETDGNWWSSTEMATNVAWVRHLLCSDTQIGRYGYYKTVGCSVRCMRDY